MGWGIDTSPVSAKHQPLHQVKEQRESAAFPDISIPVVSREGYLTRSHPKNEDFKEFNARL